LSITLSAGAESYHADG